MTHEMTHSDEAQLFRYLSNFDHLFSSLQVDSSEELWGLNLYVGLQVKTLFFLMNTSQLKSLW